MKLTVSEYAKRLNVSVQTVYKKIKRGVINTVKENNTIYVVLDDEEGVTEVKQSSNPSCNHLLTIIENLQEENKHLAAMLDKANDNKDELFHKFMNVLAIEKPKQEDVESVPEAEEAEIEEAKVFTKEDEKELKRLKKKRKKKKLSAEEILNLEDLKEKRKLS